MEFETGIVCGLCDRYSPMGTKRCRCGNDLNLYPSAIAPRPSGKLPSQPHTRPAPPPSHPPVPFRPPPPRITPIVRPQPAPRPSSSSSNSRIEAPPLSAWGGRPEPVVRDEAIPRAAAAKEVVASETAAGRISVEVSPYAHLSQEELMEQARNFVCRSCSASVPMGHKFCGRCGAAVPPEIINARTVFFSDMQNPAKAKLVLIRGEGMEGLSYHLRADQHIAGRNGNLQFPDDPFVSPRHANFFYRDDKLVVRDEASLNGVYIRIRGTIEVAIGDTFLAGEQMFRLEANPLGPDAPDADGTYFYSSPKHPGPFRIVQIFEGGTAGMSVGARTSSLQIGREGGDLNFPGDPYMSGTHCRIEESNGKLLLTDLNSRNGSYVRITSERELAHGDYLFLGRKLLRVELNTN
jgi:pSer/pThr/pTyr-binding forkhead associated (FHA) protein